MKLRAAPGLAFGVALAARLAVVLWAARAIPPTADGSYYDIVARRIAEGHGYTWLWPDGAVTYAAHYPVGYPGMVGVAYAIFGEAPVVAMILNALLGAAGAAAACSLLARATTPRLALAGGLAVALHPALVPYTAALMTEGVTASLLVIAAALAARAGDGDVTRWRWVFPAGLALGLATLVRPQSLALAPLFGALAWRGEGLSLSRAQRLRARLAPAAVVTALALLVCAPWTARNCARMERCALVSVNGGWNLAIGTQTTDGAWKEIVVPDACKEVFQEAKKDDCFGREASRAIAAAPGAWLARAPAKLRATFDYFGAAPWYLHAANARAFPYRAKVALAALETLASRLLLAGALVAVARLAGPRRLLRRIACGAGLFACLALGVFGVFAAPPAIVGTGGAAAYLACALGLLLLGPRVLARAPLLASSAAVILATAATHAVFFGAGRYGLVVVPFVTALAFVRDPGPRSLSPPELARLER